METMPTLLDLPHEVLHGVLREVDPHDLAAVCRTCQFFNCFVRDNRLLHKELFLKKWDDPSAGDPMFPWEAELSKLVKLDKILASDAGTEKIAYMSFISQSITSLLQTADIATDFSRNVDFLSNHFQTRSNVNIILGRSSLLKFYEKYSAQQELEMKARIYRKLIEMETVKLGLFTRRRTTPELQMDIVDEDVGSTHAIDEAEVIEYAEIVSGQTLEQFEEELSQVDQPTRELKESMVKLHIEKLEGELAKIKMEKNELDDKWRIEQASRSTQDHQQICAKLHCLYGIPIWALPDDGADERETDDDDDYDDEGGGRSRMHHFARSRVYDLRRYTRNTFWGPFHDDGSQNVDWEKMEAIMIVLDLNFKRFKNNPHHPHPVIKPSWEKPWLGATPNTYRSATLLSEKLEPDVSIHSSIPIEPEIPLDLRDPYNVTGTWRRIVCFLDYSELFTFNFADLANDPPAYLDRYPLNTEEAIRLIIMELRLIRLEAPGSDDGQGLPVAHFRGNSRSMHSSWDPNAHSDIKGMVKLTPEGEVRWTTWSIYQGEERWRSEGIQIGGRGSARGVMGNWFDKDYDEHGPAGPTAFWKHHDGFEAEKKTREW